MSVMVFGTFDNLHPGHEDCFRQAGRLGRPLVAVIARDNNVLKAKGHLPQQTEKERARRARAALKKLGIPGKAVLGNLRNQWLVLKRFHPELIALGYDQKVDLEQLKSEIARFRFSCKIRRLKSHHPEKYKSSYCLK